LSGISSPSKNNRKLLQEPYSYSCGSLSLRKVVCLKPFGGLQPFLRCPIVPCSIRGRLFGNGDLVNPPALLELAGYHVTFIRFVFPVIYTDFAQFGKTRLIHARQYFAIQTGRNPNYSWPNILPIPPAPPM
jgi:hypothetical protein